VFPSKSTVVETVEDDSCCNETPPLHSHAGSIGDDSLLDLFSFDDNFGINTMALAFHQWRST
jgi:hypothetical protein